MRKLGKLLHAPVKSELVLIVVVQAAVVSILAVPEGQEVVVIGTIYKDMKLKPSILDEYVKVCPLAGSFHSCNSAGAAPPCQVQSKDAMDCG